jgi:polyferredoxin
MVETRLSNLFQRLLPHRIWVQVGFLALWLDPLALRMHQVCGPVFHCYACPLSTFACPIGVIAQFGSLHLFPFLAVGLLVVVGGLVGSLLCGWACPFGLLQDLAAKVPTPKIHLPAWTGHLRYVMLVGTVLLVPYVWGESHSLFICRVCPVGGIEVAVPNVVTQAVTGKPIAWPNPVKLAIVAVFLITIFFIRRPWCRVLCPLGAIFSLLNKVSALFLRVDRSRCTDCKRCRSLCAYDIQPDQSPNDSRCIRCLECTRCGRGAMSLDTVFRHSTGQAEQKVPSQPAT